MLPPSSLTTLTARATWSTSWSRSKDRARYAVDASRDSLQEDQTLRLTQVPTRCQQAAVTLVGTFVYHCSASVHAEATKMFWKIAVANGICPEVHYRVPEFAALAGGNWAALGVGLYSPIECPRAVQVTLQFHPGNVVTLRNAKLRHHNTCQLMLPHTAPWHGHHGPHHPFADTDDP